MIYLCACNARKKPTMNRRNKMKNNKHTKKELTESYFYIALVIKGTEKQYKNLLKHVNNKNGAKVINQCKSLTYLRIYKDEGVNIKYDAPIAIQAQGAEY